MTEYADKLKDPRWQRKRLEVFERDNWACQHCTATDRTLAIHHKIYMPGFDPWDYSLDDLVTLCEYCHNAEYENRPIAEQELLAVLKRLIYASDFKYFTKRLKRLKTLGDFETLQDVIGHATNPGSPAYIQIHSACNEANKDLTLSLCNGIFPDWTEV